MSPESIQKLKDGIYLLSSTLADNLQRVTQIIDIFIAETPMLCDDIYDHIVLQQWEQAAVIVHKIKTRYSQLGLTDLGNELSVLESKLRSTEHDPADFKKKIKGVRAVTDQVVAVLQQISLDWETEKSQNNLLPLTQKLVLIAEDDEVNAMVFDLFVRETGASTKIATDGIQAVEIAKQLKPDLVFMDVHMPFFSGLEAIRTLRASGCTCPIISLSASSRLNERLDSLEAGANEFIVKPANRDTINSVLLKYLTV